MAKICEDPKEVAVKVGIDYAYNHAEGFDNIIDSVEVTDFAVEQTLETCGEAPDWDEVYKEIDKKLEEDGFTVI